MAGEGAEIINPGAETTRFAPGQRVKYVPNHRSFGAFMRSEQMRSVTAKVARDVAKRARVLAPRSLDPDDGVHMADQFYVDEQAGFMKVSGNVRVKVTVGNDDRAAAPNEFGSKRNQAHHMLAAAGAEFGDLKPPVQDRA